MAAATLLTLLVVGSWRNSLQKAVDDVNSENSVLADFQLQLLDGVTCQNSSWLEEKSQGVVGLFSAGCPYRGGSPHGGPSMDGKERGRGDLPHFHLTDAGAMRPPRSYMLGWTAHSESMVLLALCEQFAWHQVSFVTFGREPADAIVRSFMHHAPSGVSLASWKSNRQGLGEALQLLRPQKTTTSALVILAERGDCTALVDSLREAPLLPTTIPWVVSPACALLVAQQPRVLPRLLSYAVPPPPACTSRLGGNALDLYRACAAYDGVQMLSRALDTPQGVSAVDQSLLALQPFAGISGDVSFGDDRARLQEAMQFQVLELHPNDHAHLLGTVDVAPSAHNPSLVAVHNWTDSILMRDRLKSDVTLTFPIVLMVLMVVGVALWASFNSLQTQSGDTLRRARRRGNRKAQRNRDLDKVL